MEKRSIRRNQRRQAVRAADLCGCFLNQNVLRISGKYNRMHAMRTFYWHEKKNLDLSRFFLIIGVTRLELVFAISVYSLYLREMLILKHFCNI